MTKTYCANASPNKTTAPYGTWPSPISIELLTASTVRLSQPQLNQGHCYWVEQRPEEKGRSVVVCQQYHEGVAGKRYEVTPAHISVHSKAQEYGGASYIVDNGILYFVNGADQRVYSLHISEHEQHQAIPLSPEGDYRYADFFIDHQRQQLICICEIHRDNSQEPENNIISLRLDGSSTVGFNVLVFGNDFYSNPTVSHDGEKLSWLTWNHPNMPWDNSECWIADFTSTGMLQKHRRVAGGLESGESIFQPKWSPTGELLFVSDRNNWWNLYSYNTYNKYTETLVDMSAEFATPQWVFGMSTYGFLNSYTLFCSYTSEGQWQLATFDLMSQTLTPLTLPFNDIEGIACQDDSDTAVFIGASNTSLPQLIRWQNNTWESVASSSQLNLDTTVISTPKAITFHNTQQQAVHGFFYAPQNANYHSDNKDKPPLIVMCHGGPTGATSSALNLKIQYWTSRGFAVFDINYSGSTGYGRDYRQRLHQQWGVLDVDDLCNGANYLIEQGLADGNKTAIRGSSAGGYSVLAALTFHDTFKAGASLYGIGDLLALSEDTHKFEAHYCNTLIGEYPKEKLLYQERSPINHIDQLNCPVIFLQGLQDKVVLPNQAEAMVKALHNKNIPVAYVTFEQEGHGFRQAHNIRHAIDVEYAFYAQVFGFNVEQTLPEVPFITENSPVISSVN